MTTALQGDAGWWATGESAALLLLLVQGVPMRMH